jgi:hypothetical protein
VIPNEKEAPPPTAATPPPAPVAPGVPYQTLGFVVGGLGVASLAVGLGTGLAAGSDFSSLEEDCGGVRCTDPAKADVVDRGQALETASTVTLIVGGVLTAGGAALVTVGLLGGDGGADAATLRLGPTGASVAGAF